MNEVWSDMVDTLVLQALKNLRDNNEQYSELKQGSASTSSIIDVMLKSKLSEAELLEVDRYNTMVYEIVSIEQKHLYLQGLKDCYRLFKWFTW